MTELRVSYVGMFASAHTDGRAEGILRRYVGAGAHLRILMAELRASYVGRLGLSRRRTPSAHTDGSSA